MRASATPAIAPAASARLPAITLDWNLAFQRPETRAAADYWIELRGDRQMPSRGELKPSRMRTYLTYVSIVDRDPISGLYRVSLQSTHTREVFGELKGRAFAELFPPEVAQRWRDCFNLIRDNPKPVRLWTEVGTQDQSWLQCEVLIAPLGNEPDAATMTSLLWVFVSWRRDKGSAR